MASGTLYQVKAIPAATKGDDYTFTAALEKASFNTYKGYHGASLQCEKDARLVEAFGKLKPTQQAELLSALTELKKDAELSKTAAGDLNDVLWYNSPTDPIGKACKQAGF